MLAERGKPSLPRCAHPFVDTSSYDDDDDDDELLVGSFRSALCSV